MPQTELRGEIQRYAVVLLFRRIAIVHDDYTRMVHIIIGCLERANGILELLVKGFCVEPFPRGTPGNAVCCLWFEERIIRIVLILTAIVYR